jgi:hypothetical protein
MSAPIRAQDSTQDRLSKLLPADITAAFLSAKAGILALVSNPADTAAPVFWTFIAILAISPFYFWYVTNVRNLAQLVFLCLSFVVFAISIATSQLVAYLLSFSWNIGDPEIVLNVISTVLPVLWVFIIAQIFVAMTGNRVEQ